MTEESLEKGKDLQTIMNTLKGSIVKIDTMTPGLDTATLTIAIVKDPKVITTIRKALNSCIDEKQEEFSKLANMATKSITFGDVHEAALNKLNEAKSYNRIPTGSDYDLDKVKVQQTANSTGISFGDICASMIELHDKKNADYGDAFTKSMDIFGMTYLLSRLHDKVQRLISINDKGTIQVTSETMLDTLMDLACYAIMGIEYYQNIDK